MINTQELLDLLAVQIAKFGPLPLPGDSAQKDSLIEIKGLVELFRDAWNIEFMPTSKQEVAACMKYYDIDEYARKGMNQIMEHIQYFFSTYGIIRN